jgi:hypothetical protein
MGFNKDQAQRLLCEKDWVLRMLLAWEELPALERKKASELDYDKVENYWPNLDFCGYLSPDNKSDWA